MVAGHQGFRCIPILVGGLAAGCSLAAWTYAYGGPASAPPALAGVLPLALAALTGVAKTTTA